jgi:phosphoribosylaminoimidazolecarboxamide formyltransferase/IMP cyclohydrolase
MIRASAKNFIRVASVVDPGDYGAITEDLQQNRGRTSLALRFALAQKAFAHTAAYDRAIADYLGARTAPEAAGCYRFQDV